MTEVSSRDDNAGPLSRTTDPESSHLSAREVSRAKCAELHRRILLAVGNHGALIEERITEIAEGHRYTNCPHKRVSEMREAGYLERVPDPDRPGKFLTAPSSAQGRQQVLRLTEKGIQWVVANRDGTATPQYVNRGRSEHAEDLDRMRAQLGRTRAALDVALAGLDEIEECLNEAAAEDREEVGVDIRDILEGVADRLDRLLRD